MASPGRKSPTGRFTAAEFVGRGVVRVTRARRLLAVRCFHGCSHDRFTFVRLILRAFCPSDSLLIAHIAAPKLALASHVLGPRRKDFAVIL
jgi:hypothetical protein